MLSEARQHLARIRPINVTVSGVLYHPEAIMLGFTPEGALASHPPRCTASHAHGNGTNGQRYRACRAMDSPYNDLLQHGKQPIPSTALTTSPTLRKNPKSSLYRPPRETVWRSLQRDNTAITQSAIALGHEVPRCDIDRECRQPGYSVGARTALELDTT